MATKLPYVLPFEDGSVVAAILLKAQGLPETEQIATKTELQQATAYLATLDNATMAPQSAAVKRETDNLQAQINNIVRAPESGGDVGAEVYQARVGADGTTYQTLKARLDAEENATAETMEDLGKGWIETGPLTFTDGKYIRKNGALIDFSSSAVTDYVELPYNCEQIVLFTNMVDNAGLAFYDENQNVISGLEYLVPVEQGEYVNKFVLDTIPYNANYIRFSCMAGSTTLSNAKAHCAINVYLSTSHLSEVLTDVESEIKSARVGADGTSYNTLKARLDAEANSAAETEEDLFKGLITTDSLTFTDGVYIRKNGALVEYSSSAVTGFVDLPYNCEQIILFTNMADNAGLAFYDENQNVIGGLENLVPVEPGEYVNRFVLNDIPSNANYIRFSCLAGSTTLSEAKAHCDIKVYLSTSHLSKIVSEVKTTADIISTQTISQLPINTYTENAYIDKRNGNSVTNAPSSFNHTDYYEIPDLCNRIIVETNLVDDAGLAMYDENKVFIGKYTPRLINSGTAVNSYEVMPPTGAKYIRSTVYARNSTISDARSAFRMGFYYDIRILNDKEADTNAQIETLNQCLPLLSKFWSYAMDNIICIGDSLTEGCYYGSTWTEKPYDGVPLKQNYPYMLGRMLRCGVENAGFGGYSASDWWSNKQNTYDFTAYDTAIIWLGTNGGLTDTLDTDCIGDDYTSYANTNTGNYCKIIGKIKQTNPWCKIVVVKVFASGTSAMVTETNRTIGKIATRFGVVLVDNSGLGVTPHPELHDNINNIHFGKAGNIYLANKMIIDMGQYFDTNPLNCEYGFSTE